MSKASPTSRTLAHLRGLGYLCQVVEQWLPHQRIRRDLFGIGDVFALMPGEAPLLVQCTSGSNVAARITKALALTQLPTVLASGVAVEVWGWRLAGARGRRKTWQLTRRQIVLADLTPEGVAPMDSTEQASIHQGEAPLYPPLRIEVI